MHTGQNNIRGIHIKDRQNTYMLSKHALCIPTWNICKRCICPMCKYTACTSDAKYTNPTGVQWIYIQIMQVIICYCFCTQVQHIYTVHWIILGTRKHSTHAHKYTENVDTESLTMPLLPPQKLMDEGKGSDLIAFPCPYQYPSVFSKEPLLWHPTSFLRHNSWGFKLERCATPSNTGISELSTFLPSSK